MGSRCGFNLHFPVNTGAEHLFMWWLTIWNPLLWKYLFIAFAHFFIWVVYLFLNDLWELFILDSGPFVDVSGRLSSALWVAFSLFCWVVWWTEVPNLMPYNVSFSFLYGQCLKILLLLNRFKKSLSTCRSFSFLSFRRGFLVLRLTFRSLIHPTLIFLMVCCLCSGSFLFP